MDLVDLLINILWGLVGAYAMHRIDYGKITEISDLYERTVATLKTENETLTYKALQLERALDKERGRK